ncbi:L2 [Macaca mulatta papillomavirus 7]|uniref:L2 n=1 Tax=Macaca mulatta papillomavirus 7 TaxID=2364644 RepID=UPI000EB69ABA|nr:L2 [Macaca mulatta papillomavirus 7]AYD74617.1 L2 [Macaca mulatta papillomavirus 7]
MYKVRRKRAAPEDLYRTCATGDCPPDVKNKIEGNTLADRLLKWFSSIIYLGGLGIGTGRGSGGSLGYRPIGGSGTRPAPDTIPIRPAVPVDPLGPPDIVSVDTIDPAGPSIISETTTTTVVDPSVIDVASGGTGEIEHGPIDPISDIGGTGGHPTIITTDNDTVAVLDVQPIPPPNRAAIDVSVGPGDSSHVSIITAVSHPSPDINVFVDPSFAGETVGYDEIPLQDLGGLSEFEIDEGPTTSTPIQSLQRVVGRARNLYHRFVQQIPTRDPAFLGQVSRLAQFEYENPAFDPDITVEFQRDLEAIEAAPVSEFQDIRILHRPLYSLNPEGAVRVSRLGQRGTITTRSGLQIGQPVHFYYDVSEISPVDSIELSPRGEFSGTTTVVDALAESTFIDPSEALQVFEEEELYDRLNEDFTNSQLVLTATDELGESLTIPSLPPGTSLKVFVDDYSSGIIVNYPTDTTSVPSSTIVPSIPSIGPAIYIDSFGSDYYLHPSLIPRKRKRMDMF